MFEDELDELIKKHFGDVSIDKRLSRQIGGSERSIPDYVTDWLVSRYSKDGIVDEQKINTFLSRHLPDKKHKNTLLYELNNGATLKILDAYSVRVDIEANRQILDIPSLDISNGGISNHILIIILCSL